MTALTQMAAARPPGIADARVPCPLCGGLIHPVAGRCKHCKEDLSSYRAGRPQAAAALPALNLKLGANGSNGHVVATAVPVVIAPRMQDTSQPILPPRTTARSIPAQRSSPSIWRSWPMLVIALAAIAIVAATVIMIMPQGDKHKDGKMSAPPAPERMQTNPMPDKHSQTDPWDNGAGGGPVPRTPDPIPPKDPDDDIWGGTGGLGGGGGGLGGGGGGLGGGGFGAAGANLMIHVLDKACKKFASCPDVDQSSLTAVCEAVAMMPKPPMPSTSSCPAAQRCFDSIDRLSCKDAADATPHSVFTMFNDCMQASRC